MTWLQHSYRIRLTVFRCFLLLNSTTCILLQGQGKVVSQTKTATAPVSKAEPQAASAIAQKQSSIDAMNAAMLKQRASVQSQLGSTVPTNDFFTSPWTTPPVFQMPILIPTCGAMPEDALKVLVAASAKTETLQPELIRSVIRHESASYPCAVSEKGALGLMQLLPEVAQQFGADPLDPKQNVVAGSKYLKQLMTRYKGDTKLALAAYNAGPQRVDADGKVPDIPETMAYVDAILKDLSQPAAHQP
jgi:soluble lytic murein transglycosylase-like protein